MHIFEQPIVFTSVCGEFMTFSGTIPVVVGAPNILEFAPYPGSVLHIKELKDVDSVATTMKHLASNPDAFNQTIRLSALYPFCSS